MHQSYQNPIPAILIARRNAKIKKTTRNKSDADEGQEGEKQEGQFDNKPTDEYRLFGSALERRLNNNIENFQGPKTIALMQHQSVNHPGAPPGFH